MNQADIPLLPWLRGQSDVPHQSVTLAAVSEAGIFWNERTGLYVTHNQIKSLRVFITPHIHDSL